MRSALLLVLAVHASGVKGQERAVDRAMPQTLEVDGQTRRFNLHAPSGVRPAPLIITLHGHGQSAREVEDLSGWNAIATEHGAVIVYPLSRGVRWRIFGPSSPDVDFLLALIDRLAADGLIDPAQVFVNGYSGGAQMSWRFACQRPDRVAAAGFVAGAAPDGCGLGHKPPVILFHGEADLSLPYANARGTMAIPALGRAWAAREGCEPRGTIESLAGAEQRAERVQRHRWQCDDGAPVELYSFKRGGHDWPGHSRSSGSQSVDATALMWAFFNTHR
jgi:polyhydroxybutyrate depolymerase